MFWVIFLLVLVIIVARIAGGKSDKSEVEDVREINNKSSDYFRGFKDGYAARLKEEKLGQKPHTATELTRELSPVIATEINEVDIPQIQPDDEDDAVEEARIVELTPEEKEKKDLQNINTTLYVASFLLVSAAVLFIGSALSPSIRFAGVWFLTIAFYVVGLALYEKVEKLRPAAVAFVGTGLALLPFTGIAMYSFVLNDGPICWLITSIVGLAAYVYAAQKLQSQLVAYLSIAFAASSSIAGVSLFDVGFVWYFIAMIVFGSVMTVIAQLRPTWVSACFSKPIQTTTHWIVPLTIIASVFSASSLSVSDYWVISFVSTIYYSAVGISSIDLSSRLTSIFVVRSLASLTALLMAYDFSNGSWRSVGLTLTFVGVLQSILSMFLADKYGRDEQGNKAWLGLAIFMQVFAMLLVGSSEDWASIVSWQLVILANIGFVLAWKFSQLSFTLFSSLSIMILVHIVCRHVVDFPFGWEWLALIYLLLALLVLLIRGSKAITHNLPNSVVYLNLNIIAFFILAIAYSFNVDSAWGLFIWMSVAVLNLAWMYIERQSALSLFSNGLLFLALDRFLVPMMDGDSSFMPILYLILASMSLVAITAKDVLKISQEALLFVIINFGLFLVEALLYTSGAASSFGLAVWSAATVMVYVLMYVEKLPWLSILAGFMTIQNIYTYVRPYVDQHWVAMLFILFSTIALMILAYKKSLNISSVNRDYLIGNFALFLFVAICYAIGLTNYWLFVIYAAIAFLLYAFTYLEKTPIVVILANIFFVLSSYNYLRMLEIESKWTYSIVAWICLGAFYAGTWIVRLFATNKMYLKLFWWSSLLVFAPVMAFGVSSYYQDVAINACLGMIVLSLVFAIEGNYRKNVWYYDIAIALVTIGLQRLLQINEPQTDIIIYSHWWAAAFAGMAYLHYKAGKADESKALLYIAMGTMTFFSGSAAMGYFGPGDMPYQIIFIIEHAILMIYGLLVSKKVFTTWGAVAAILAVLWMIRDLTYLVLALIAIALIWAAIYGLNKQSKDKK